MSLDPKYIGTKSKSTKTKAARDWLGEYRKYREDPTLVMSEQEVNRLKTRLNMKKISTSDVDKILGDRGVLLTEGQKNKAVTWLRRQHKAFGVRELDVLGAEDPSVMRPKWTNPPEGHKAELRLVYFYPDGYYDSHRREFVTIFNYPVYDISYGGRQFQYYVKGGEINITG